MAGSQKIILWGPQRTPLGIVRVNVTISASISIDVCVTAVAEKKTCLTGADLHATACVKRRNNLWCSTQLLQIIIFTCYCQCVRCATSRDGPGIDSRWCHWGFFPWFPRQNHVPWGWISLWNSVPGISPEVKAAGAFGWRPTTLVVPKRQENPGP